LPLESGGLTSQDAAVMDPDRDTLQMPPADRFWVVLHTRPRCEKKVVDHCARAGYPVYLPLRQKMHRYGARERIFLSPLFPGYVFCVVNAADRSSVRQSRHVANLLDVVNQKQLVEQLRQVQQALSAGDVVAVMPYLEKGRHVRVTGGALKGAEGIVLRVKGRTRVVLNVDMIRQSVAVEVDGALLAPA
jgi:transcriptional antiterminator RfaH